MSTADTAPQSAAEGLAQSLRFLDRLAELGQRYPKAVTDAVAECDSGTGLRVIDALLAASAAEAQQIIDSFEADEVSERIGRLVAVAFRKAFGISTVETANPLPADIDWARVQDVLGVMIVDPFTGQPVFAGPVTFADIADRLHADAERIRQAVRDLAAVTSGDVDALRPREGDERGVPLGVSGGRSDPDLKLKDGLSGGSPEGVYVLREGLLDGGEFGLADFAESRRRAAHSIREALRDHVAVSTHDDSSTPGRPQSVLTLRVEVSGRRCGDSRTCACGGAS